MVDTCRWVQQDIDAVVKWSHDNGLVLNSNKTKLLVIHSPYLRPSAEPPPMYAHDYTCIHNGLINCQCVPIEKVNSVMYLGVTIDEKFSWLHHIEYICGKLRVLLGKFYHLSFKIPIGTLRCLYKSLVESILGYALDSYGLTFKTYIDRLEAIQVRFLKLLVNNKIKQQCKDDYTKLFKICNILPLSLRHKYILATNNHGIQEHNLVLYNNNCNTRSMTSSRFIVPRVNNYYGDRTLKKRLPYLLNTLPEDIRSEGDKRVFKRKLWKHYINI